MNLDEDYSFPFSVERHKNSIFLSSTKLLGLYLGDGSLVIHPNGKKEIILTSSNYSGP